MENFYQIFILIAKTNTIGFNSNILETGLINIIALIGVLIYGGIILVEPMLSERAQTINDSLANAETRRCQARNRLALAYLELAVVKRIFKFRIFRRERFLTKRTLFQTDIFEVKKDSKNRLEQAYLTFSSKERQIFLDIKQEIIELTLQKIYDRVILLLNSDNKQEKFLDKAILKLDKTINKLEGDSI